MGSTRVYEMLLCSVCGGEANGKFKARSFKGMDFRCWTRETKLNLGSCVVAKIGSKCGPAAFGGASGFPLLMSLAILFLLPPQGRFC